MERVRFSAYHYDAYKNEVMFADYASSLKGVRGAVTVNIDLVIFFY